MYPNFDRVRYIPRSCIAIGFLMKKMPLKWLMEHQLNFINALFFVMMDLTNEVHTVAALYVTQVQLFVTCVGDLFKFSLHSFFLVRFLQVPWTVPRRFWRTSYDSVLFQIKRFACYLELFNNVDFKSDIFSFKKTEL